MKKIVLLNTCRGGICKTIYSRIGRLSWENFLGRMENGGWDCQMTCIMEIEDDAEKPET